MDLIKAILNQILLFFDDMAEKFKRLPVKGRRRLLLMVAAALLLILLLLILCLSSCRSSDETVTAETMTEGVRTRVRGSVGAASESQTQGEAAVPADPYADSGDTEGDGTWDPDGAEDEPPIMPGDQPAVAETPVPAAGATAAPAQTYASLKKHDKSPAVTALQNRLMELGYLDIDEPTDYFGSITETAVVLFQRQHDLKQDGIAGNETQTVLFSDQAQRYCLKEGFEGEDVEALQEQLVDLGYMSEKDVDRIYGPITVAAVQAFQRRNGLHVDGLAGAKTLELLYSDDAKPSRDKKATATPKPTSKATSKATAKTTPKKNNGKKTATPKPTKKATATPKKDTRIDKFISVANSKLGCEYKLGAKGPDKFDCSGFVYYCLRQAGVSCTRLNALGFSRKSGWKLIQSLGSIKRGDLLFFRSDTESSVNHTGIYIGSGTMIDASSGNGKVVKRAISPYFKRNFVCARRPWNE